MSSIESRPISSSYGPCSERCDVLLSEDAHEKLITLARMAGMGKSEYARRLIEQHIYGAADRIPRRDPLLGA